MAGTHRDSSVRTLHCLQPLYSALPLRACPSRLMPVYDVRVMLALKLRRAISRLLEAPPARLRVILCGAVLRPALLPPCSPRGSLPVLLDVTRASNAYYLMGRSALHIPPFRFTPNPYPLDGIYAPCSCFSHARDDPFHIMTTTWLTLLPYPRRRPRTHGRAPARPDALSTDTLPVTPLALLPHLHGLPPRASRCAFAIYDAHYPAPASSPPRDDPIRPSAAHVPTRLRHHCPARAAPVPAL
ncbi:hypothetical protein C8J57DRAFT_165545 [Mycena rebaudengoi]|nr:hypothetical protein C8J57DRAFT_165545 [Mycena rebaudengoi]